MNWNEIAEVRDTLRENNFREIILTDNPQDLENYYTAAEIARKLHVRLEPDDMNKALLELGYKNFINKIGVPVNQENSAFVVKSFTDEETGVKKYYIQVVWHFSVVDEINKIMAANPNFQNVKPQIEEKNHQKINEINEKFSKIGDFIAVTVKKTGFNINKDFVVYVSYTIIENNKMTENNVLFIDDNVTPERVAYYLEKDELTDACPYDYMKVDLPHMNPKEHFMDRKDALRILYSKLNGRTVLFYDKEESRFLKKMFEEAEIPADFHYDNIIKQDFSLKELVDWNEPKLSLKLKKVYERHSVENDGLENKYSFESKRLARLAFVTMKKYAKKPLS